MTTSDKVLFILLNSQEKYHVLTIVLLAAKRFPSAFHEVIPAFQAQVTLGRVDQSKLQRQRVHPSTCRSDYWYQAGVLLSLGIEGLEQGTVYVLTWGQCLWWTAPETHNLKTTKTVAFLGITQKKHNRAETHKHEHWQKWDAMLTSRGVEQIEDQPLARTTTQSGEAVTQEC